MMGRNQKEKADEKPKPWGDTDSRLDVRRAGDWRIEVEQGTYLGTGLYREPTRPACVAARRATQTGFLRRVHQKQR